MTAAAFRHHPEKSNLLTDRVDKGFRWEVEPALVRYLSLRHNNRTSSVAVPISATPVIVNGMGVIVASDDGRVRFYDRNLERVFWERRLDASIYASPVADRTRNLVVVVSTSGLVAAMDLRGRTVWTHECGTPVFATPALRRATDPSEDVFVFCGFGGRLFVLLAETGERRAAIDLSRPWSFKHGGTAAFRDPYASPAVSAGGALIIAAGESVASYGSDGSLQWRTQLGASVKSSPAVIDDAEAVLVATVDGVVHRINTGSGESTARIELDEKVTASPAVSGGVAAFGTSGGAVFGLDTTMFEVTWERGGGAPRGYTSFTVAPNGAFLCTTERGNVQCIDALTGRFRWETSQVLGLPDHRPELDITPVAGPDGSLYAASYEGWLYRFQFPPLTVSEGVN